MLGQKHGRIMDPVSENPSSFQPKRPAVRLFISHDTSCCYIWAGADLVNWGPQANIGMGPYTFAHIYQDQP